MSYCVGLGYDIHRLKKGRSLFLGGIKIDYPCGLLGHSDADVLIHAICDALLGAAGDCDIGEHFPDSDERYRNMSSRIIAKKVIQILKRNKFKICNIDSIVVAERPRLSIYKEAIRVSLAEIFELPRSKVLVKAKTNEGLGKVGQGKAIAAYAVVLLSKEAK